ncbi:large conductance mechanosensitive channel protein MscL [Foetidibacter luteolus]|uniref:large conductance mechanosensitive channel protein MscL n=1 Tax=Foetidibacter luteolus TaxID=2608880 RepID=UPI00129BCEA4|nr:large conductance mechanosensitive channel protein MscL [Foetidibacter luteolus]
MGFLGEFKKFAVKGNVIDLAVGVIIGGAFGKIVDSVVKDLIMPLVGTIFEADFSNLYIRLSSKIPEGLPLEKAREAGPVFAYGNFLTIVINFLILAFVIFLLVKGINSLKDKEEAAAAPPPGPSSTDKLLMEIRDELKAK